MQFKKSEREMTHNLNTVRADLTSHQNEAEEKKMLSYLSQGDDRAFWALWEDHKSHLFALCLRQMGGIREDAEDALSRAMLKAWDSLPYCASNITNLRAWLNRLVYNLCVDIHRERKRRSVRAIAIEEIAADDGWMVKNSESPEDALFHREMFGYVRGTIESLPDRLREPFVLRFFHEMPYPDIAQQLTLSPDNVRKRIQQARAILRQKLDGYADGIVLSEFCAPPSKVT